MATARSSLRLLGGFELVCAGTRVRLPFSAQRLLAFVALHDNRAQRAYVAGSLWTDSSEDRAHANLRSVLWRLRRAGVELVDSERQQLSLRRGVDVDIRQAEMHAHAAVDGLGAALDLSLLAKDLLPDWYEDWVTLERERFRQLRLRAFDALSEQLITAGRVDAAVELGLAAVAGEPLRESSHRTVVRAHLANGNAAEALRQYHLCRRLLGERLGIEPSAQMEELVSMLHVPRRAVAGW